MLNELAEPIERQVFVVTDTPGDLDSHRSEFPNLTFTAFSGKRSAFIRLVVRLILTRKIDLLLIGHVNYAPLGLLMRLPGIGGGRAPSRTGRHQPGAGR